MNWPVAFGPGNPADLERYGPTLKVILHGLSTSELSAPAPSYAGDAVVDTGASCICVDKNIVRDLALQFVSQISMTAVGASHPASRYIALVEVPELRFKKIMPVCSPHGVHVAPSILLGRSFLKHFIITFNGITGVCHATIDARDGGSDRSGMYEENDG